MPVLFLALTVSDVCSGSTGEDACHFSQSFMFNLLRTEYVVAASRVKMVCVVCVVCVACVCQSGMCAWRVWREGGRGRCMHAYMYTYICIHAFMCICMHAFEHCSTCCVPSTSDRVCHLQHDDVT